MTVNELLTLARPLTYRELASRTGVTDSAIGYGYQRGFSRGLLVKIAAAFGKTEQDITDLPPAKRIGRKRINRTEK